MPVREEISGQINLFKAVPVREEISGQINLFKTVPVREEISGQMDSRYLIAQVLITLQLDLCLEGPKTTFFWGVNPYPSPPLQVNIGFFQICSTLPSLSLEPVKISKQT